MAEPRLVVRIAANLEELRQQLGQAVNQIETTKGAFERMTRSFSGAPIIRDANAMVAAIDRLGGVTKLTANEQARVHTVVSEALAKYRALGLEAPEALREIAKATERASTETSTWVTRLGKIGAVIVGGVSLTAVALALKQLVIDTSRWGANLADLAAKAGVSATTMQALDFALRQIGGSAEEMIRPLVQLQQRIGQGGQDVAASLKLIGLSLAEARRMQPDELLRQILNRLHEIPNAAQRAAIAQELFGRGSVQVMALSAKSFDDWARAAESAGAIARDRATEALDRLGDAMSRFMSRIRAIIVTGLGTLVDWIFQLPDLAARGMLKSLELVARGMGKLAQMLPESVGARLKQESEAWTQWARDALAAQRAGEQIRESMRRQEGDLRRHAVALGGWADQLKSADKAAEAHQQAVRKLADELSGKALARKVTELAQAWASLSPQLRAQPDVLKRVGEEVAKLHAAGAKLPPQLLALLPPLQATEDGWVRWTRAMLLGLQPLVSTERVLASTTLRLQLHQREIDRTAEAVRKHGEAARRELERARREVSVGAALGGVLEAAPQTIVSAFTGGGGLLGAVRAIAGQAGSALGQIAGTVVRGMGGMVGRVLGAVLPAVGALAGPAVEALIGLFRRPEWQKVTRDIGRDLGVRISEELAKAIAADAKRIGDRVAASLLHLPAIIREAGGVEAFGLDRAIAKTRDLFVQVERGLISVREAGKVVDEMFGELLPHALDKTTGLARESFVELIRLSDRFGISSRQISQFVREQAEQIVGGLKAFLSNATVSSQQAADAMVSAAIGAFGALRAQGASVRDAIAVLDPVLDQLAQQLTTAGLQGGEAFERLRSLSALARDEIAGPALTAVDGLRQTMAGLANLGLLNRETFAGLARQVADTFNSLVAQGKSGQDALVLMAPTLQTIWELQRRYKFTLDETTQALVDQAVQAGLVGEQHRSSLDKAADAMLRVAEALERLIGGTREFGQALASIPSEIVVHGRVDWDAGELPPGAVPMQHGGIVTRPTLALVGERGPEAVIPLDRATSSRAVLAELSALRESQERLSRDLRFTLEMLPRAVRDAALARG